MSKSQMLTWKKLALLIQEHKEGQLWLYFDKRAHKPHFFKKYTRQAIFKFICDSKKYFTRETASRITRTFSYIVTLCQMLHFRRDIVSLLGCLWLQIKSIFAWATHCISCEFSVSDDCGGIWDVIKWMRRVLWIIIVLKFKYSSNELKSKLL